MMVLDAHQMRLVDALAAREREHYEAFDAEVEAWYADPETSKWSFPRCIHGSDRWTDYDNICGGCEDGYNYFEEERAIRDATDKVQSAYREFNRRMAMVDDFREANEKRLRYCRQSEREEWSELCLSMFDWAFKPLQDMPKVTGKD